MIVLHSTKYGDNSLILHVYSEVHGRTGLLLRGAGRSRSTRSDLRLIHPLSILDVTTSPRPNKSNLIPVQEFGQACPLPSLRANFTKSTLCLFIGELLYRTLRESSPDPELYRFLVYAIRLLESLEDTYCANFHLWFLVGYASQLGFLPHNDYSPEKGSFHIPSARFERTPAFTDEAWFSPFSSELLSELMRKEIGDVLTHPLTSEKRNDFCRAMLRYLRYHFDLDFEVKSLDVLYQVLHP